MTLEPGWTYRELQQTGLDFEDQAQVEAYDRNQGADPAAERALIAALGLGGGDRVIDLGCGTGCFAIEAARACGFVHAVDVSRAMLAQVGRKAEAAGLDNLSLHHGGFLSYRHEAAPADAVVTRFALHHLPDFWKMAALLRLHAMLRPGGLLFLRDVVFSFPPADYAAGVEVWIETMAQAPGAGFTRADFETHLREEYSTYAWIIEGMLTRAGFRIEAADYASGAYASYCCRKAGETE
ncbi:MAG: class I SAM-dependent methyltransferase [Kiloniellales bacterium]